MLTLLKRGPGDPAVEPHVKDVLALGDGGRVDGGAGEEGGGGQGPPEVSAVGVDQGAVSKEEGEAN